MEIEPWLAFCEANPLPTVTNAIALAPGVQYLALQKENKNLKLQGSKLFKTKSWMLGEWLPGGAQRALGPFLATLCHGLVLHGKT